jgi:peptidoglycan/xylan/chitin deacetylase (PgdA/CDA1 family)
MPTQAALLRAALKAMQVTRAGALLAPMTRGIGVVFTLHHVRPDPQDPFSPNRILSITPDYLDRVIGHVLDAGYDVVRLDELPERLARAEEERPFACFTFDDGYRDNRDHALPIFERYGLPLAIYVAPEFADGRGDLWWLALEEAIRRLDTVALEIDGERRSWPAVSVVDKTRAYDQVYWWLRSLPEARTRAEVARLCETAGYDPQPAAEALTLRWDELRELACHPLITLGAHTLGHWALAKLDATEARRQIVESVARVEAETGQPCRHFSFPYGDPTSAGPREFALARELGLRTAVTTRKSLIHARHRHEPTALPRLSLNGDYQDIAQLEVLLTGAPFALLSAAERLAGRVSLAPTHRNAASTE